MAKQINWGYQFKRNFKGPIDPDTTFKTYEEMVNSPLLYNGAIVSVTDDESVARQGIYLILGNDDTRVYTYHKGSSNKGAVGLPFILTHSTEVLEVVYQGDTDLYKIVLQDNEFANLDIIGWNIADDLSKGDYAKVEYSLEDAVYIKPSAKRPSPGDTIFHIGNLVDPARVYFPAVYIKNGFGEYTVFKNTSIDTVNTERHTYIGRDNVGNPILYSLNAYLKGTFLSNDGVDLGEALKDLTQGIQTGLNDLREEFSSQNRITNPFFLEKLKGWTTVNDARFFKTLQGKWIWNTNLAKTQEGLYSLKRRGAYIDTFDERICLSIQEGSVLQEAKNLRKIVSDKVEEFPKLMDISFMYYVVQPGTMKVTLGNTTITFPFDKSEEWAQIKTQMSWDGTASLEISFNSGSELYGEVKVRAITFQENEIETFKNKYSELLEYSDILVEIAKERINNV